MPLSAATLARLRSFLETLPEDLAARLAALIEADKRAHAGTLPHDEILEALRPKLDRHRANVLAQEIGVLASAKGLAFDRTNQTAIVRLLLEYAPHEIAKALPVRAIGSFSSTHLPDVSTPTPPERIETALGYARLIVASRDDPAMAPLRDLCVSTEVEIVARLRTSCRGLLAELRAAEAPRRNIVEQYIAIVVALTSVLLGQEEADALQAQAREVVAQNH